MSKLSISKILILLSLVFVVGCSHKKDLKKLEDAHVRSILIVPPANNSQEVSASEVLLSTLPIPVAEGGYYVFPVHMVKRLLEDEGLSDTHLVHSSSTRKLASLFGADAVLYATIEEWNTKYLVLSSQTEVKIHYTLKDAKSEQVLWEENQHLVYTPDNGGGGGLGSLISAAVVSAVHKAAPDYLPLARQASANAFIYPGPGLLPGPYSSKAQAKAEGDTKAKAKSK